MIVTPSTELDAVNEILSSVGASPISTLEDDLDVDSLNAQRILEGVSKEVQSRGYDFNTLNDVLLMPDADSGFVPCPNSYLRFFSKDMKLIRRSGYFFDQESGTNEFPEGLEVGELVKELPFNELPDIFRKYITVRACRIFQMRYLTSQEIDQHLMTEESSAYADLVDYDLMQGNYNIYLDDKTIFHNIQRR